MTIRATHRPPAALLPLLLFTLPFALLGVRADAQVNPTWDHYKVYQVVPNPNVNLPVTLVDQFGTFNHVATTLDWFATPVQKQVVGAPNIYPINDPITHYAWWKITDQPFNALVLATNQFGTQSLVVQDAAYLLNPALKNQTGPPPVKNHYKCYLCSGQAVNVPVVLTDQFDTWQTTVAVPKYFCTPAEKIMSPTQVYPIVDPNQHYVCYQIQPPDFGTFPAFMTDQFIPALNINLYPGVFLCVPSTKDGVTPTTKNSWGSLKLLYR